MKRLILFLFFSFFLSGPVPAAFGGYAETNRNNTIDWYNIIDGVHEYEYRNVSSKNHVPFEFNFNGFAAQEGKNYEMTLRHAGNRDDRREKWILYIEGDAARFTLDDLVYSNAYSGYGSNIEYIWVDQVFSVTEADIAQAGANWNFVLEPGTKRYSVLQIDTAQIASVPVPGALLLLGSGLAALAGFRRK